VQPPAVPRLIVVQALRGLAALSIAMLHALYEAGLLAGAAGLPFAAPAGVPWAAGVDLFFVISGLIMVHASAGLFGRPGARKTFLVRRLARIVPLYWAVTALYLALALAAPALLNSEVLAPWPVLASFLFIPFARPDGVAQPLYSLGWTLNYEMAFYALFAAALAWPRRAAVPALIAALAGLAAIGQLRAWPQPIAFWTAPIILEFAFGLAIGGLRAGGVALRLPVRIALAAAGLALLGLAGLEGAAPLARPFAWGVPAALIVAAAALGPARAEPRNPVARAAAALGDASYALYLVHPFAIRGVRVAVEGLGVFPALGPWGFVALALAGAVAAAVAVHRGFERPAMGWVRGQSPLTLR
jgi:exopolysaccharide production protein ExoZ